MNNNMSIFFNEDIKIYDLINDKYKNLLWGLRFVRLENTWTQITEKELSKIRIALIDSGIDNKHEDLKECVCTGYNFIANNYDTTDDLGHGTRIAGVIAAKKDNGIGVAGVASGAKIVPLKVMDSNGRASIKNVTRAIEWCLTNDIDVINLSIGYHRKFMDLIIDNSSADYNKERLVIEKALESGISIISSVGNDTNEEMKYPARYKGVISVASYGIHSDTLEIFPAPKNNKCSSKTIFAPGEYIFTTDKENKYTYEFGSSIACGFVTGAIALIKSVNRYLSPMQIQEILIKTCTNLKSPNINILNIDSAFSESKNCNMEGRV